MNDLRLLDLFSGIGGFSLAAKLLGGFRTIQFVEQDSFCQRVLRRHWPSVPIHDDIRTFTPSCNSADVVCAGFPCQDISVAGKKAGIKKGTRSGLFYELMRVVRLVGPRYIVLENVSAITTHGLDTVLGELAEAGFDAEWACIPASAVGACHRRDRWWCVAHSNRQRQQECNTAAIASRKGRTRWSNVSQRISPDWRSYLSKPIVRRGNDGIPNGVDRLKSLGNAVVPQVAMLPLARVLELAKEEY